MKIGITAATYFEIQPTIDFLLQSNELKLPHEFKILITGIGSLASAYEITKFISRHSPACMIQAGIGGSFTNKLSLGETVMIREEVLGDFGVEENNLFTDMFDLALMEPSAKPFTNRRLINPDIIDWEQYGLPLVNGITVNEITTRQKRISLLYDKYHCEMESMEGAAFHYVCLQENVRFIQLRSVSNYIGERDKKFWKLKESIENLNHSLINIIQQIP